MDTLLDPPTAWTNQKLVVYHGTLETSADRILEHGVSVARGLPGSDFGIGFYTTTLRRQAGQWAWNLARKTPGLKPAILEYEIDRDALGSLEALSFVRGDHDAEDFWSFVVHCRLGRQGHARSGGSGYYDVVFGPVAAFWERRALIQGADQISFHTAAAERLLNDPGTQRRRV